VEYAADVRPERLNNVKEQANLSEFRSGLVEQIKQAGIVPIKVALGYLC
jgi:hypothetical protein